MMMKDFLSQAVVHGYYFFLSGLFVAFAVLSFLNLRRARPFFYGVTKKTWFILLGIVLAGLVIRVWAVSHTHHVYFDEFEHVNLAENFLHQGKYCISVQGSNTQLETCSPSNWPPAYHYLLSLALGIFGDSEAVAFNFSAVIGTLSIVLMFLVAFLFFRDERVALFSAFLFNVIPVHLKYSGASETGITSLFFILWLLLSSLIYIRCVDVKSLLALISSLALSVYCRPENSILLVLIPAFLFIFLNKSHLQDGRMRKHVAISLSFLSVLMVPYFVHLYLGLFVNQPPGWWQSFAERVANLKSHLAGNSLFWFGDRHPLIMTLVAIVGIFGLIKRDKKALLFNVLWFSSFLVVYSFYHIGSFPFFDGDRYTLNLYIAVVLLAAFGLREISAFLGKGRKWILGIMIIAIGVQSADCLWRNVRETFQREVYQEYEFILANQSTLPDDAYIIAYNPSSIISTIHKKALSPDVFKSLKNTPQRVIFFKDYWYGKMPGSDKFYHDLMSEYNSEILSEMRFPERCYYSFIKLEKK